MDLKVLDLKANVSLAQLVRHWTLKLVISCITSSPTGSTFFAVVKSFAYNNAISANFVQTVKNSNGFHTVEGADNFTIHLIQDALFSVAVKMTMEFSLNGTGIH